VAARRRCDGADRFGCSAGRTACVMQRWGLRCLLTAVVGMSPGHKHLRQHVIAGEALRGDSFPAQHDVAFKTRQQELSVPRRTCIIIGQVSPESRWPSCFMVCRVLCSRHENVPREHLF